jgi:hypothetical protein
MVSPITSEQVYGPNNRILSAQLKPSSIPRDHIAVEGYGISAISHVVPWRTRWGNAPSALAPSRTTKFIFPVTQTSYDVPGCYTHNFYGYAYATKFDPLTPFYETSSGVILRGGELTEIVADARGVSYQSVAQDAGIAAWSTSTGGDPSVLPSERVAFYSLYKSKQQFLSFKESVKQSINILDEVATLSEQSGGLPGAVHTALHYATTVLGQLNASGASSYYYNKVAVNPAYPKVRGIFASVRKNNAITETGKALLLATDGSYVVETCPELEGVQGLLLPLAQDPNGVFRPYGASSLNVEGLFPTVVNNKRVWKILLRALRPELLAQTPPYKYASAVGRFAPTSGEAEYYITQDSNWSGLALAPNSLVSSYIYGGEDPFFDKASRSYQDNYVENGCAFDAGTDSPMQMWSVSLADWLKVANSKYTNEHAAWSTHDTVWPKKVTLDDGGLFGSIEVSSESPATHWVKNGAYISSHSYTRGQFRLDVTVCYAITDVFDVQENNVTVKKYKGIVHFSHQFSYAHGASYPLIPRDTVAGADLSSAVDTPIRLAYYRYVSGSEHHNGAATLTVEERSAMLGSRATYSGNTMQVVGANTVFEPTFLTRTRWGKSKSAETLAGTLFYGSTVPVTRNVSVANEFGYPDLQQYTPSLPVYHNQTGLSSFLSVRFGLTQAGGLDVVRNLLLTPTATVETEWVMTDNVNQVETLTVTGTPPILVANVDGSITSHSAPSTYVTVGAIYIHATASGDPTYWHTEHPAQTVSWTPEVTGLAGFSLNRKFGEQILSSNNRSFSPVMEQWWGVERVSVEGAIMVPDTLYGFPNKTTGSSYYPYQAVVCLFFPEGDWGRELNPTYLVSEFFNTPADVHYLTQAVQVGPGAAMFVGYTTGLAQDPLDDLAPSYMRALVPTDYYFDEWDYNYSWTQDPTFPFPQLKDYDVTFKAKALPSIVNNPLIVGVPSVLRYHALYLALDFEKSGRYAFVYWKPGMHLAYRICNPFLLGGRMPSLAEMEALLTTDIVDYDATYNQLVIDEQYSYAGQVTRFNLLNSYPASPVNNYSDSVYGSVSSEGVTLSQARAAEWAAVRPEVLNAITVWQNNKLVEEYTSNPPPETPAERVIKIDARKSAALRLWQAVRVIKFNNFLLEDFFLQYPVDTYTTFVYPKDLLDRARAK